MAMHSPRIWPLLVVTVLGIGFGSNLSFGHEGHRPGSCASSVHEEVYEGHAHHHCDHGHDHHDHHYQHDHLVESKKLLEELAEEEDLELYGFGSHHGDVHHHDHGASELSGVGIWIYAMGCSLLVSMASLICLIILPVIFMQGKPSKEVVDSLALFGAGAMLGDAFLHQLPHAFGGEHSNSHDHVVGHAHSHVHFGDEHSHSHSLKDISVGLSVLAGIVLFLLVEKIVRYVEDHSRGASQWTHSHNHQHNTSSKKLKNDSDDGDKNQQKSSTEKNESTDGGSDDYLIGEKKSQSDFLRKRNPSSGAGEDNLISDAPNGSMDRANPLDREEPSHPLDREEPSHSASNLVFGYLNLFSDGVHNFTDGMALGSAFLLYGSVGGWSRTLFLLVHELPQEIGDFGILVRSGFSVSKALFFNFLSALVALAGTAVALLLGQDPGQSSLIEGFTAGGFIYIAVAGVLAQMNNGSTAIKNTAIQLTSLVLGMSVAIGISLVE